MEEKRPDPETLLAVAHAEEQRRQRGKLKIFFGACAGVGKTFGMLEAARQRKRDDIDVLIGVVETHRRKETEALLEGLDALPLRFVEYKNTKLQEFDLDGALARKPALILVDELAHTNAPGCKNAKRWQDVEELLAAGINVYSAVNVQHLESLNDVVAKISGVIVRETIPDSMVEQADEIELMDLPPDDLIQRLADGKVYVAEQAGRAREHFFKKGNLSALRELALRCTADRVNQQMQSYRDEKAISGSWPTQERILVCVGPGPFSAQLIRAARRMASGLHAEWIALYVETPAFSDMNGENRERLQRNLRLAEQLGGETVVLHGTQLVEEIVDFARKRNATKIIFGKPLHSRLRERLFGSTVDELIRQSGDIDVYVIKGDPGETSAKSNFKAVQPQQFSPYALAFLSTLLCTGIAWGLSQFLELSNLIMLYLLGVIFTAVRLGRGPAIFASVLSVAAFDFFFVPPHFTFAVSDTQYIFTFIAMLIVSVTISSLTARIQSQARDAGQREQRTAALYAMSRELSQTRGVNNLLDIAVRHLARIFDSNTVGLLPDETGRLLVKAGDENTFPYNNRERGVAQWVFDLGKPAGLGTDTLPGTEALYVPMNSSRGVIGVIGIQPKRPDRLATAEQMNLLETCAAQTALAIECVLLTEDAQHSQVEAEAEKSRNILLSSVSHDLRTPLASISGAATALIENDTKMDAAARREMAETISEESNRLARLVTNLLEMTRLESKAVKLNRELCPLAEVVGAALTRLERPLAKRSVAIQIPESLPPLELDVVLMEQVFMNLLENALKYTPENSAIEIVAAQEKERIKISVADRGPGFKADEKKRVFDKFFRSESASKSGGVGLGLPICKAVIELHGGKIEAENRPGGGAVFVIWLPVNRNG